MGFSTLLGNERLKENLTRSLKKGHISHFYLISGPEGSGKHTLAHLLAAAILCQSKEPPCMSCHVCRRVLEDIHPDVIWVEDKDKKTVTVDLMRQARADAFIRPNEAAYKIYVIPRAQDMRLEAQNALLKILEEPPEYAVFLLLADNPNKMLPTIRSRCTALNLNALPEETLRSALHREFPEAAKETLESALERSGGFLGQAKALMTQAESPQTKQFVEVYLTGKDRDYAELLCPMEKWKRDQLAHELTAWRTLLADALLSRGGMRASSPLAAKIAEKRQGGDLLSAVDVLQKAIDYTQGNVSPAAVCGWLFFALRQ